MSQAEFIAAVLDPDLPPPAGVRTWNGSDAAARFAIYRNNVIVTLGEALASAFPAVKRLVGDEFFAAMAGVFVRERPPASPVLAEYGAEFADFLAGFPPVASLPYLPDVARLEFAMLRAYHAADAPAVSVLALAMLPGESLSSLRFSLHDAVRVIVSDFAVVTLVEANRAEAAPPPIDAGASEDALVYRAGFDVRVARLGPGVAAFLRALLADGELDDSAALAKRSANAFNVSAALTMMFELPIVVALRPAPGAA